MKIVLISTGRSFDFMTSSRIQEVNIDNDNILTGVKIIDPQQHIIEIDITRRSFRMTGNAWDITRVEAACKDALKKIEHRRLNPLDRHIVSIQAPSDDET